MDQKIIRTPCPKREIWTDAIYPYKSSDICFKHYEVSNIGRIRVSIPFNHNKSYSGKIIKTSNYDNEYKRCNLFIKPGKYIKILVHRLVARSFFGPIPNEYEINHKNLNKAINWVSNLEYVTRSQNCFHNWKHNTIDTSNFARGDEHAQSKLNNHQVRLIKRLSKRDYPRGMKNIIKENLASKYQVSVHTINCIWWGKGWRHINV